MLEAALSGLVYVFHWPAPLFLILGSLLGMLFGLLPGLGGPQVLALLTPLTFAMDERLAVVLLVGAMGAVPFGGSITAILLNTPGTGQSAATTFDGFPLARQGKAGMAIGASATASALGAVFGAAVLTVFVPIGRQVVLAFSYPEYFMLAIMGLSVIAVVSPGATFKALIAGGLGLFLSSIGYDPVTGSVRYAFGLDYLWDGVKLVPALIGIFAIGESIELMIHGEAIAAERYRSSSGVLEGVKAVFRHFGVFLRGSITGTIIGIIPGVGGAVANFLAYFQVMQSAKDPEKFGTGDIRGVIAPESANNAKDGGALVPTVVFGIPGSIEMAVLLGALIIHGLEPGPKLLLERPDVIFTLIYSLVLANLFVSGVGLFAANPLSRLTTIPVTMVSPVVFSLAFMGAYAMDGNFGDVIIAFLFGILGYALKRLGFSRVALVIALLLGEMAQKTYFQTLDSMGWTGFLRPISFCLLIATVLMLLLPLLRSRKKQAGEVQA